MDSNKAKLPQSKLVSFLGKHNIRILTFLLVIASAYFFTGAQKIRSITSASNPELFSNGDIVNIIEVIDGDEVLIGDGKGGNTLVRLLGIQSFSSTVSDPLLSGYGQICFQYLKTRTMEQKAKIEISSKRLDNEGRLLGTLFLLDTQNTYTVDLALELVEKGYTLVYTKYDFANMNDYLQIQNQAKQQNAGFWSDERIQEKALSLQVLWDEERLND